RAGVRAFRPQPDPFLGPEEEHLVALPVEVADNDRTTQCAAELVHAERCGLGEQRVAAGIPAPGIRVELVAAEEVVSRAVEVVPAALRHESNLAARRSAV